MSAQNDGDMGAQANAQLNANPIDPFSVAGTNVMFDKVIDDTTGETYLAEPQQVESTRNQRMMSAVFNVQNGQYTQILNSSQIVEIELTAMNIQELRDCDLIIGFKLAAPTNTTVQTGTADFVFMAPLKHLINNYQVMYGGTPYCTFNEPWNILAQYIQLPRTTFYDRQEICHFEGDYPATNVKTFASDLLPAPNLTATVNGTPVLVQQDIYTVQPQYHFAGPRKSEPARYNGGVALSNFIFYDNGTNVVIPQELLNHAFIRTWTENGATLVTNTDTSGDITRYASVNFKDWWTHPRIWWPLAGQRFKLRIQFQPNVNLFPFQPASSQTYASIAALSSPQNADGAYIAPLSPNNATYAKIVNTSYIGTTARIQQCSAMTITYMQMWMSGLQMDSTLAQKANNIYLTNTIKTRHVAPRYLKFPYNSGSAGVQQTQVLQGLQGTFANVDIL